MNLSLILNEYIFDNLSVMCRVIYAIKKQVSGQLKTTIRQTGRQMGDQKHNGAAAIAAAVAIISAAFAAAVAIIPAAVALAASSLGPSGGLGEIITHRGPTHKHTEKRHRKTSQVV